jgi:hypothetical protein
LHFGCYQIPRGGIPRASVTLDYRFGTGTARVNQIHQLCAPTDKNGEDPSAVGSPVHMSALPVTGVSGTFTQPNGVTITTQFGTYTADVRTAALLLAPTSKSLTSKPPPLVTSQPHRLCNKLVHVVGPGPTVHLEDQFTAATGGINPSINARGPDLLCLPVDKNGGDPSAPANPNGLLCLRTRNDRLPFAEKTVFITNQFGSFKKVITQYDDFCVPATVTVP